MHTGTLIALCLSLCLSCASSTSPSLQAGICPDDLPAYINKIMNCTLCERSYWGVLVHQLTSSGSEELFSYNAKKFFAPASNNKVLTTASAFLEFGPQHQLHTPVYVSDDGKTVCLAGQGDPSITYDDLSKVAALIAQKGLNNVEVVVDNTYYQGADVPSAWEWEDLLADYGAQPSALIVNENQISITVTPTTEGKLVSVTFNNPFYNNYTKLSVSALTTSSSSTGNEIDIDALPTAPEIYISGTVRAGSAPTSYVFAALNPTDHFLSLFAYYLVQNKVTVTKKSVGKCNSTWKQIATLDSPTLSNMMNWTLQVSDNLYAETFLKQQGKTLPPQPNMGSSNLGIQVVAKNLASKFGVDPTSFKQLDGSGLSYQNLVSPQSLVELLIAVHGMDWGALYLSFLPTAGVSGTLDNRFINTPAQGILHAKTGSLSGVNALSGFVDHKDNDHPIIIFSILQNGSDQRSSDVRAVIDSIGVTLALVQNC